MVGGDSQKIQVLREAALERKHSDREAHHDGGVEGGWPGEQWFGGIVRKY